MSTSPQDLAAQQFMEHKGLGYLRPYDVEPVECAPCWYYYYQLPEGVLELEVAWTGSHWETTVCAFNVAQ